MRGRSWLLVIALVTGALSACGGEDPAPTAPAAATAVPPAADLAEERLGRPAAVSGQANIFGAGRAEPPQPGGGGAGKPPPGWQLSNVAGGVLTVRSAGRVNPIVGDVEDNGASGDGLGPTDVTSYQGISGIVDRRNGMFLVGVFLTDDPPSDPAPRRLDVSSRNRPELLAPRLGQTFDVGDGKHRTYRIPTGATRLYLGFADAYQYQGDPGWYDNNGGKLTVTVRTRDPEPG